MACPEGGMPFFFAPKRATPDQSQGPDRGSSIKANTRSRCWQQREDLTEPLPVCQP